MGDCTIQEHIADVKQKTDKPASKSLAAWEATNVDPDAANDGPVRSAAELAAPAGPCMDKKAKKKAKKEAKKAKKKAKKAKKEKKDKGKKKKDKKKKSSSSSDDSSSDSESSDENHAKKKAKFAEKAKASANGWKYSQLLSKPVGDSDSS